MIMASHQTFSSQVKHLSNQTKFAQTNLLNIINGEIVEFTKEKQMSGQFPALIYSYNYEDYECRKIGLVSRYGLRAT